MAVFFNEINDLIKLIGLAEIKNVCNYRIDRINIRFLITCNPNLSFIRFKTDDFRF